MTVYFIGVVVVLLITLTQVAFEIAYEKEDRISRGAIVFLAFFSWLLIFTIIMTAIFSKAKKAKEKK